MTSNLKPPHVIIVGGGFGGLYAARGLADAHVQVTILDKHNYHLFRPMLYQVATGLLSADEIAAQSDRYSAGRRTWKSSWMKSSGLIPRGNSFKPQSAA